MEICVSYHDRREWIVLPASIDEIAEAFDVNLDEASDFFGDEITIEDIETDLDFKGYSLASYDLDDLNALAECEDDYYDEAVAISEAWGLNEVHLTACKNAYLIPDVKNAEELGEALVNRDYLSPIPDHLKDYIDYEKFGESFDYDGTYTTTGFLFDYR